jgi:hypothetical protein
MFDSQHNTSATKAVQETRKSEGLASAAASSIRNQKVMVGLGTKCLVELKNSIKIVQRHKERHKNGALVLEEHSNNKGQSDPIKCSTSS